MAGPTSFSPTHRGRCIYDLNLVCMKCALVKAGYGRVDKMKDEEIEVEYWKMKEREQEKARKAKEMLNWMMLDHDMQQRRKREQQQKERDQLKKMNPLTMHDSRATYIRPTTTSSYQLKKPLEYKTDNREQGYWETSSRGGTASKTHYSSSSASQVSWACPSKPSRAMTSKTPPKQPHPPSNRLPGRR